MQHNMTRDLFEAIPRAFDQDVTDFPRENIYLHHNSNLTCISLFQLLSLLLFSS